MTCNSYKASTSLGHWNEPTSVQRRIHTVHIAAAVFLPYRTQLLKFLTLLIFFELLQVVWRDELQHFSCLSCITEEVFQLLGTSNLKIAMHLMVLLREPPVVFLEDRISDANSINACLCKLYRYIICNGIGYSKSNQP